MRKVDLNMNEYEKYITIKKLIDNNGNKKRVAIKLGISLRHVNRLIVSYNKFGKLAFSHGNKGKISPNKINDSTKSLIIDLFSNNYPNASHKHFTEILYEHHNIKLSYSSVRNILLSNNLISIRTKKIQKKESLIIFIKI